MNILIVDLGTSAMKQYLMDETGTLLWEDACSFPIRREGPVVEMDANLTVEGMKTLFARAGGWCAERGLSIMAVALTSQRSSVMGVDEKGCPLHPMMMWQSRLADDICCEFKDHEEIYDICGMSPVSVYSAPKILWLKRRRPDVYQRAVKFVGFYEWLLFHLTGAWITDVAVASRSCLTSLVDGQWSGRLLEIFGIDRGKLCDILPVGSRKEMRTEMAKLLRQQEPPAVVLAGGDQQCAAVGAGCLVPGDMQINTGTGGYMVGMVLPERACVEKALRYNHACLPPNLLAEASVLHCGNAIARMADHWYGAAPNAVEQFTADACMAVESAAGFVIDPAMIGDDEAWQALLDKGLLEKWKALYGIPGVNLALLDGIIGQLADGVEKVSTAIGNKPHSIACGGGLTRCELFCRRLAKQLGMTVIVPGFGNSTAVGALMMARRALCPGMETDVAWRVLRARYGVREYPPQ